MTILLNMEQYDDLLHKTHRIVEGDIDVDIEVDGERCFGIVASRLEADDVYDILACSFNQNLADEIFDLGIPGTRGLQWVWYFPGVAFDFATDEWLAAQD